MEAIPLRHQTEPIDDADCHNISPMPTFRLHFEVEKLATRSYHDKN
jgi:hypothetical protein